MTVKLARFEGPLDLLLHLIKRDEIDIYDIPIAHITQQYLAYLELMRALDLEVAGEFLVMAATLMRIKAKMLLPLPAAGEEEEEGDPREELVQRLVEYRQFKEAAGTLKLRGGRAPPALRARHGAGRGRRRPAAARPGDAVRSARRAQPRARAGAGPDGLRGPGARSYDVEDKIALIARSLVGARSVRFIRPTAPRCRIRAEMIVTFIALLELIKLGQVSA